jgi:hypothetical protein
MLTVEQITELKAAHGSKLEVIQNDDGDDTEQFFVVAKPPSEAEYDRFTVMLLDDDQKARAMKTLVRACVVYPEASELKKMLGERPGLVGSIGKELSIMAGAARTVSRKKL